MKVVFTGGGTAGHILPIIAVTREIKRSYSKEDLRFCYIGPKDRFSATLFSKENIKLKSVLSGKIRRYINIKTIFQNLIDILKIPIGIIQAFFYIFFLFPDLIFSKGGYGSIPVVIAGWILRVPIFLHESDVSPGFANRILSRFALEIFISFPVQKTEYFSPKKLISAGNPIRTEILEGSSEIAKKIFSLTGIKPVILVLGGSQGAQRVNDLLLAILPQLLQNFELIHQCGQKNFKTIEAESKVVMPEDLKIYYHLFSFLSELELKNAYKAASLVVSRAGSGTIFEIAACQIPSILIPLPESAQNHQVKNAYLYAERRACIVIEEDNLTPHFFLEKLKYLFSHPQELEKMGEGAKDFARPKAAKIITEYIMSYLFG